MRFMGFLFIVLTFLAGITIGSVALALVNVVLFLGLALLLVRVLERRFGANGLVFGMAGAFFASLLWPVVWLLIQAEDGCPGENCQIAELRPPEDAG